MDSLCAELAELGAYYFWSPTRVEFSLRDMVFWGAVCVLHHPPLQYTNCLASREMMQTAAGQATRLVSHAVTLTAVGLLPSPAVSDPKLPSLTNPEPQPSHSRERKLCPRP